MSLDAFAGYEEQMKMAKLCIDKAIESGWDPEVETHDAKGVFSLKLSECKDIESRLQFKYNIMASMIFSKGSLFSHEFNKNFWNRGGISISVTDIPENIDVEDLFKEYKKIGIVAIESKDIKYNEIFKAEDAWKHHLKEMVIHEDPLKYMYDSIEDKDGISTSSW